VGDKWSFRIALDDGFAWRGMTTFSVQNPLTRDFLSEWLYHELLHEEKVITPRYGFVELRINGISKGLYAYEEHFEKQIVEYNSHREGPILKYDEEGLWELQEQALSHEMPELEKHAPIYQASDIVPFGAKAILKDSTLMREFRIAQQLVQQYKTGQKNVWDIFDAAKVARYYAIIDLLNAQHGLIWHNQRWYYNPVLSRLEPIGFDGFTEVGPLVWIDRPIIGFARNVRYMAAGYRELMFERFFHNRAFVELYVAALMRYTSPKFLDAFYFRMAPQLKQYERWVQHEWPDYIFNIKGIFDRARSIRLLLTPMERSSVKAHLQGKTDQGYHYRVYNYHCLPVTLQGVGSKRGEIDAPFTEEKLLDAYNAEFPAEYTDIYCKEEGKYVFFKVPGIDDLYQADILPWPQPEGDTPEQELFEGLKIASNELYTVDSASKKVTFKSGTYKTSRDVLIPAGYKVWFEQGVTLDLVGGAKFISKSEVIMFGSEEAPIHITSSDESANGFTILQAPHKSEVQYVIFDHLGALHYKGWNLTGAVTFYESEVVIDRSRFVSNHSDDALNPIRSVFTLLNSYIGNTSADGLDADFCHVSITNATISHTGKDAMEFTGGQVTIMSAQIDHAQGNGIGFGEECAGTIIDATLRNCAVGLATEDLSTANVIDIALYDNAQGIVVRQKRPEFGPASVVVKRHKEATNAQLYVVEPGSKLSLSGQEIEGKR
jgi:CotH kinase protein